MKIAEKNSVASVEPNNITTVNHNVTKHISYNIQDSVVSGNGNMSEITYSPSSIGVVKDGFEWLGHEGNHYYRPANQPNTQWQMAEVGMNRAHFNPPSNRPEGFETGDLPRL